MPLQSLMRDNVELVKADGTRRAPPRVGMVRVDDPDNRFFVSEPDEATMTARVNRSLHAAEAIEKRGVGGAVAQALGERFARRDGANEGWVASLGRARDAREKGAVRRAIAEWADGDTVAAHIGYGIDYFCTEDRGIRSGGPSILDANTRHWLETTYGVVFVTLRQLADMI